MLTPELDSGYSFFKNVLDINLKTGLMSGVSKLDKRLYKK